MDVVFENLDPRVGEDEVRDAVLVFRPVAVLMGGDRRAIARFADEEAARTCSCVIGLRPDLLRRKLGGGVTVREEAPAPKLGGGGGGDFKDFKDSVEDYVSVCGCEAAFQRFQP